MRNLFLRGAATLGLAALGACADGYTPADPLAAAKVAEAQQLAYERATARVARGMAMALSRDELRHGVLAAMRKSPYVEHKLVFQEFIATDLGRAVMTVAAERLGEPVTRLQEEIALLPRLDFYLPVSSQRETWTGSPDILVAALYRTKEATVDLYRPDGNVLTWSRDGAAPPLTVVVLHPAERRALRSANGGRRRALLDCDPEAISCDPGGGGGGDPTHGVYIDHFNPQDDDGWGFGDDEVRFTFTFESDGEVVVINRTQAPFVGSDEDILVSVRACDAANNPPHFTVHIEEDDGGLNGGDDEWGTYYFPPLQYNVTNDLWYNDDRKMWLRMKCL